MMDKLLCSAGYETLPPSPQSPHRYGAGKSNAASPRNLLFFIFVILGMILSACSNVSPETAVATPGSLPTLEPVNLPNSAWGNVQLVAQAETLEAPAFLSLPDGSMVFSWTGAQENEARLYSRGVMGNGQIMAFKAYFPFEQDLINYPDGILTLWLDRTDEQENLRLRMGLFSSDGIAKLGPANVSDLRTQRYSAQKLPEDYLYTVWSGGIASVSNLYLQTIDEFMRPIKSKELRVDADYPALLNIDNKLYLFWLEANGRDVYTAHLEDDALTDIRRVAQTQIDGSIAIDDFSAAYDGETVYLFWNLRLPDDSREVLFSTGLPDKGDFSPPTALGISAAGDIGVQTPYKLSDVHGAALSDGNRVSWASPVSDAEDMLPVAVNLGEELGVAFFQKGQLVAYQSVVQSGKLIGLPNLQIINQVNLALSWSAPSTRPYANLFFTETQALP